MALPPSVDRYFRITERGSTVAREVRGGFTTFMAMAYILLLNPVILSVPDVTKHTLGHAELTTATALAAAVTTLLMAFVGNAPLALAAGLGVSGVVAFQVAPQMTWHQAFGMCVIYGACILILAVTGLRQAVMDAIPVMLKHAITIGIGLFIALIGLVNAGFVSRVPDKAGSSTPVQLGLTGQLTGWPVLVFCLTLMLIFALMARRTPGAILIGIIAGTILGIIVNAAADVPKDAWGLTVPELPRRVVSMPDFGLLGHLDFGGFDQAGVITGIVIIFTLVLAGFFDAMATIIGIGTEAGLVDAEGRMPGLTKALAVDGVGGIIGGVAGASGQTVFIESATGAGEGARTGFASLITGGVFVLALFFTPLAQVVPSQAAAAALVVIGSLMLAQARHIDWRQPGESIPAFMTIALMPFTYSITAGVGAGVIVYTLIKTAQGRWREAGWLMWVLTVVFLVYFALHPIEEWLGVS